MGKEKAETTPTSYRNDDEKVNPDDELRFADGSNSNVSVGTVKAVNADGSVSTTTTVRVDVVDLPVIYTDKDGNKVASVKNENGTTSYYKVDPKTGLPKKDDPTSIVDPANIVSSLVNPTATAGSRGAPTSLTNIAAGAEAIEAKDADNNPLTKVGDKWYKADQLDNGQPKPDVTGLDKPSNDTAGLADLDKSNPHNAMTVADAKNLGWVISTSENEYNDQIRNANKLNFVGDNKYISVTGKTKADGTREVKVSLKTGEIVKSKEATIIVGGKTTDVVNVDGAYYKKADIDPTTGRPKDNATAVTPDANTEVVNKGDGLVTGNQVADAIQKSGFTVGKAKAETTPTTYGNADEKVNPDDELRFADGSNTKVSVGTVKAANADGSFSTTTTVKVDLDRDLKGIDSIANKPDGTGTKITLTDTGETIGDAGADKPVTITNAGKITNVVDGEISPTSKDAVNGSQLYALAKGNKTSSVDIVMPDGSKGKADAVTAPVTKYVINDKGEKEEVTTSEVLMKTYNVNGQTNHITNSAAEAIYKMNEQGIKFFHTNDGTAKPVREGDNRVDSSASGIYSTAIGFRADARGDSTIAMGSESKAGGKNAIAMGRGSQALAENTISVGHGNIVAGKNSGAIGDPSYITDKDQTGKAVDGSYSIGNHNVINSSNTFVLGNDVNRKSEKGANGEIIRPTKDGKPVALGKTVENSVYLGNKTTATAGTKNLKVDGKEGETTTAGTGKVDKANVNGVIYGGFAGDTAHGVVSVGASGSERRIQNVAAGEISATSTDAINGSQLYQVAARLGDLNNKVNRNNKQLRAGIAGANAAAGLPQVYIPGKSMVAASVGTYKGQNAVAVGYSRASDNGKVILKLQGNANTRGEVGGSVGVGYQW